jgi:hypothetical protein
MAKFTKILCKDYLKIGVAGQGVMFTLSAVGGNGTVAFERLVALDRLRTYGRQN